MYIDENFVSNKVKARADKIITFAKAKNIPFHQAAMFIDGNAKKTTNKAMLREAGYIDLDVVTKDNFRDVLYSLKQINVNVITNDCSEDRIVSALNNIINDEINECWGGPDMQEYVDITPDTE